MKITSVLLCFCILTVSVQFAFAETNFKVKTVTVNGKKSKESAATIKFSENSFSAVKRKRNLIFKEFNYADIVSAEYSYSKTPVVSRFGVFAASLFIGVFAYSLMFLKKKQHWLAVRTNDDYLVLRLDGKNYQEILSEFDSRKIEVKNLGEEGTSAQNAD
ncbi:MAG TPA: hypothetical protein VNB22_23085 [Pyrinomonadaceae bacterium]|nr:hypothetical protein [Pyrinomonadaceae bacterium]